MLARLSFPIHDVSGGDASSMVWAFYGQVVLPMRLPMLADLSILISSWRDRITSRLPTTQVPQDC